MKLYVLDTDTVSHLRNGHPVLAARAAAVPSAQKFITVITVEEQLDGWYALLRKPVSKGRVLDDYARLAATVR
jgi:tRNA(fMet)-specific endonuclease VapC